MDQDPQAAAGTQQSGRGAGTAPWLEVAALFGRLGFTAFGGPAAHIAMMRQEVVRRRRWLSDREFLDLIGLTNLIPGPNSTEMAIHLGLLRAGWPGLVAGGAAFILPAALMVGVLAWAYRTYGTLPQAEGLLYGVKPVVIAIVAHALASLARTAARDTVSWLWAAALAGLYWAGVPEIPLLLGGGLVYALARGLPARQARRAAGGAAGLAALAGAGGGGRVAAAAGAAVAAAAGGAAGGVPFSVGTLFWTFLKIGSVLYGSGYVLLAFLRRDFVERLGWLSDAQLLDAVSVGQFTPGPLFTTATFVGYLAGGPVGAAVATVAIFLPSFLFVAAIRPLGPRLRRSTWTSYLLDGVNLAAVALMAGVTLQLARGALVDPVTWALALASLAVLVRFPLNSAWLVAGGGVVGLVFRQWVARG